MLVRIWVLYVCKLIALAFGMVALSILLNSRLMLFIALAIILLICIAGALIALIYMVFRRPIACPNCGGVSVLIGDNKRLGVECGSCGMVTANPLWDFNFRVDPPINLSTDSDSET